MLTVLDTNIVVSRHLRSVGVPARVFDRWERGDFDVFVSPDILAEYNRALRYPSVRRRHGLTEDEIRASIDQIHRRAILVVPASVPPVITRDPSDDIFLACAVSGGADVIVSGDVHLLELGTHQGIRILRPSAFLALLDEQAV